MTKPAKFGLGLVAAVLLLLVAVFVAAHVYLTKDRILGWVVPPMEEALHRQVKIADAGGGLTGLYLTGLDVRTTGVDEPLVAAEEIRVGWNLWALLGGKVEVTEVRLVRPRIQVVRQADGSLDISDLLGGGEEQAPATGTTSGTEDGGRPVLDVLVALVSIEDGRVSFDDRSAEPPRAYTLDQVETRVTDFTLTGPVQFSFSAAVPLVGSGRLHAEGTAYLGTRTVKARVGIDGVELPALNPFVPPERRFEAGSAALSADLVGGVDTRLVVTGEGGLTSLVLSSGDQKGAVGDVTLTFEASYDPAAQRAKLDALDLSVAQQTLRLTGSAALGATRPRFDFRLTSDAFAVDPVLALLPPGSEAAEQAPTASGDAAPTAKASGPARIPVDVVGDVKIGRLEAGGVAIDDFTTHLELLDGVLDVKPVAGALYGGTVRATARARLEAVGTPFEADWKADGVGLSGLVAAAAPSMKDTITGTLAASGEAAGTGDDPKATVAKLHFEAKDGKLVGHPMVKELGRLFGTREFDRLNFYDIRADLATKDRVLDLERFVFDGAKMQATGTGTVGLEDRALDLRLAVAVQRNLARKLVPNGQVLDALTDAQGWSRVPLRLEGTAAAPSYGLDTEALGRAASGIIEKKAKKLLTEKVLKKVPLDAGKKSALEKGLKSLFGR